MQDTEEPPGFDDLKDGLLKTHPFLQEIYANFIVTGRLRNADSSASPVLFMTGNLGWCYLGCHRTLTELSSTSPVTSTVPEKIHDMLSRCYPMLSAVCTGAVLIGVADAETSIYHCLTPNETDRFAICSNLLWTLQRIAHKIDSI